MNTPNIHHYITHFHIFWNHIYTKKTPKYDIANIPILHHYDTKNTLIKELILHGYNTEQFDNNSTRITPPLHQKLLPHNNPWYTQNYNNKSTLISPLWHQKTSIQKYQYYTTITPKHNWKNYPYYTEITPKHFISTPKLHPYVTKISFSTTSFTPQ